MQQLISIRGRVRLSVSPAVCRSVGPSVRRSVGPSVGPSVCPSRVIFKHQKSRFYRYRVFLPSDATSIGAFAGDRLPAGTSYATPAQKRRIREIGAISGCHTCGRRSIRSIRSIAQWFGTTRNQDVSSGPLAFPFTPSLAPLTHSLSPHCLLCWCALLSAFAR